MQGGSKNGCGFFHWYDPPMNARSRKVIPGLLRRIRQLEARIDDEIHNEVELSGSSVSSLRMRSNVDSEVNSTLKNKGRIWGIVRLVLLIILLYVGSILGKMM